MLKLIKVHHTDGTNYWSNRPVYLNIEHITCVEDLSREKRHASISTVESEEGSTCIYQTRETLAEVIELIERANRETDTITAA